jgi:hypothetical protein
MWETRQEAFDYFSESRPNVYREKWQAARRGLLSGNTPRQKGGAGKTQAYVIHCWNKADYRGGGRGGGLELNKDATGVTQNKNLFFKIKISLMSRVEDYWEDT